MKTKLLHLSEVIQTEKDIYDNTYIWNLKKYYKQTYLQKRYRLTDIENKLTVTKGERGDE